MTHAEAVEKAKANKGAAIEITQVESAKDLVGKTLTSPDPKNTNRIEVVEVVNGNFVVCINGSTYNVSPVAWMLQNIHRMNIE